MIKFKKAVCIATAASLALTCLSLTGCSDDSDDEIVLRVANWEEYIDLGDWDDDEVIDIENPYTGEDGIIGINSVYDDFCEWFNSQDYGFKVSVEYSTFGTNEDLYNRLNLGDIYDLVCPSDYLIMKLIAEDKVQPYSEEFQNPDIETNYYAQNVSEYIDGSEDSIYAQYGWIGLAACYMWGTTGLVYNPDEVSSEDASTWKLLLNEDYSRKVTIKDNVRDAYFVALAIANSETLTGDISSEQRSALLNATDDDTIAAAEDILKAIKENVYSFETDSGKSDMVTGKVVANFQWSGDGIYILDDAEQNNDTKLWFSIPDECTNLWFDGWVMLKDGINGDAKKQTAAEAFVNYLSRPDIAIRNMYYIGYTSSIAGELVFDYMDWNYGLDLDPESEDYCEVEDIYAYDLSQFFGSDEAVIYIDISEIEVKNAEHEKEVIEGCTYNVFSGGTIDRGRQLFAQYPPSNVTQRSVVMMDFGDDLAAINQMWINVRCLDLLDINPVVAGITAGVIILLIAAAVIYSQRYKIFKPIHKKGYVKVD